MSGLVIVYHRQPMEETVVDGKVQYREHRSPNGIIPALRGFFEHVGSAQWVAWTRTSPQVAAKGALERLRMDGDSGSYDVVRVPLSSDEVSQFYHVTSKEALWPVINSSPGHYTTHNTRWSVFREVNKRFAKAACEVAAPGAVVWLHDYNLWLAPGYIRELRPDLKIAFFHHTAFPAADLFNMLPWRDEILDSLLCCDQVGFHVPRYASNFARLAEDLRGAVEVEWQPVDPRMGRPGMALSERRQPVALHTEGRRIAVDCWPIGTSASAIRETARRPEVIERAQAIRGALGDGTLILSVGRVDYVKGVRQQLEAYSRLLKRRPELQGKVRLLLVAVAPADGMAIYRAAQREIEQLTGQINGHFGTMDWMPVVLSTTPMPFDEVVAANVAADIAWITPLRDGLNLVAKEYAAAKDGDAGVLVLSEFAGSAVELPDAVSTNPYSMTQMDEAIDAALDMPVAERRERMARMASYVGTYDMAHWTATVRERFAQMAGWDEKRPAKRPQAA